MKKLISLILALLMLLSLAACGKKNDAAEKPGDTMTPEEILNVLYEGAEELPMSLTSMEVPAESFEYFLFIPAIEGATAWVSEPAVSSIAHSVVVLRLPDGTDVEAVHMQISENMIPDKWLCVTAEKMEVVSCGNTILLVMSTDALTDLVVDNFEALWA